MSAPTATWWGVFLVITACSASVSTPATSDPEPSDSTARTTTTNVFGLPSEAVTPDAGGDPRPIDYWMVWNTCATDNRADEAEANGGAEQGWFLMDDLLADPGIQLGDHLVQGCEEALHLFSGRTADGEDTTDPAYELAGRLLAAELNLGVGSESCPAAEEAVVGAHLVLSAASFDGTSVSPLDAEAAGALPRLLDLLGAYNRGDLCR